MKSRKNERGKRFKYGLIAVFGLLVAAGIIWLGIVKFEGHPPVIKLSTDNPYVSAETNIQITAADADSGIRRAWAAIMQDGKETVLFEQNWKAGEGLGTGGQKKFPLEIQADQMGLTDGKALLRVAVWDHSWRGWFSGNRAYIEKELVIDTVSPRIEVLTRQHNVRQGGSGLLIYRLSETCEKHGVSVDNRFYKGYSGYFDDPKVYVAFFAVAHDQESDAEMVVRAVDRAGNSAQSGFYYHLGKRRFGAERLTISDRFLRKILPEFQNVDGLPKNVEPIKQFLFVNSELRHRNNQTILSVAETTDTQKYWSGAFERLPNSARKAAFADHRTYAYKGEVIDKEVHLGIDLASVRQAPVTAANTGRVAYVGRVGIYGNIVTIDHGFGLFSLYAHLSRSLVKEGQMVNESDVIGYTGSTGLAGGDHLHFGMFIQGVYVNPVEWWDETWIRNNVTQKLKHVRSQLGNR